jgi:LuxR family maltose regulon positive regulatory protein
VTSSILTTKLFIPSPRPNYVARTGILESLDEAINFKLTLVAAPPGYGKSSLLSIWIQEREPPTAWLSLDPDDNDPALFFEYLIAALQTLNPKIGATSLALLQSPQLSSNTAILSSLINDLTTYEKNFVLILDDYHSIEQQEIHDSFNYLIDHMPPQMHVIIASRSDPPLQLSQLRVRNHLLEIRQSDLRLQPEEANEFLNHCMGLNLSTSQVDILESRTEGWVAGLQLAALSLKEKDDVGAFINTFSGSHRFVIDYLADQVIANQPPEVKSFLQKTAILDRFTAQLCDEITGRDDSKVFLQYLEEINLFLIPLDDQREWFRYHHLFLDYLRVDIEADIQRDIHLKVSEWYLEQGLYPEAVKHAILSEDTGQTIEAVLKAAPLAIEKATFTTLFGWFDALPDQVVRQNAMLSLYKSFALFFTDSYREALPYAIAAKENIPKDIPSSTYGQLLCIQAHISMFQGDLKDVIRTSRDALEYLAEEDTFFRSLTLNVLGQVLEMKGDVVSAVDVYRQGFDSGYQAGEVIGTMVVFTNLVISLNELGRLREAEAICQKLYAELNQEAMAGDSLANTVYLPWSHLSYEENNLEEARKQAQTVLDALLKNNITQGVVLAQYVLAKINLINHDWDQLSQLVADGRQVANRTGTANTHGALLSALAAEANLKRGNSDAVKQWVEEMGFKPEDRPHHWVEWPYFTYTRYLLSQNQTQEAKQLLSTMGKSAQEGQRFRKLLTIYILEALVELSLEDHNSAVQRLEAALSIAAPQGYRRAFFDEDPAILELLPEVRHIAPDFVDALLAYIDSPPDKLFRSDQLYEALSERELEVLNLVAKGYSNRQIAEALYVTLGTVKKHLNNIFGKLQVKNRTQAVASARELNILS